MVENRDKNVELQLIKLLDVTEADFILGSKNGDEVLNKLRSILLVRPQLIEISLEGITGVDACFIRNSIASLTKIFMSNKGVFVSHVGNCDVLDNLVYGFHAKQTPLILKNADGTGAVYSDLPSGAKAILNLAYSSSEITTHQIMKHFDLSAPNASAKLKKLHKDGYLLAEKRDAPTGGIEYVYSPFFHCSELSYPSCL